jgi:integrase
MDGLDTYHPGQSASVLTPALRARILSVPRKKPGDGSTHWSCRKLAAALGVSKDLDFDAGLTHITHSIWHNQEGDTKTEASHKPVPLPPVVIEELKCWRQASLYRSDDHFLFPSISKNGSQPVHPDMILERHLRPALARLGVTKKIGWHSFRYGLSNQLRQNGVEIKTTQELLRHANSRITLDIYQQSVTQERRDAQARAVRGLLGE